MMRLLVLVLCSLVLATSAIPTTYNHVNVLRTLDLTAPIVREQISAVVLNTHKDAQDTYYLPVTMAMDENLAAWEAKEKKTGVPILMKKDTLDAENKVQYYKLTFAQALPPNEKLTITIRLAYSNLAKPKPEKLPQVAKQFLEYQGSRVAMLAYPADKMKTVVKLPSQHVLTYSDADDGTVTKSGSTITYGQYTSIPALAEAQLRIQYEYLHPLLAVSELRRDLEVSHWGNNLAVEEGWRLQNAGARLTKEFSRIEFQQSQYVHHQTNVLKSMTFTFKPKARDVYYRDQIGNVSTSHFRNEKDRSVLEIQPRYPMFGGWNYTWYHGYNLPLSQVLRKATTGRYVLKVPFVENMDAKMIDELKLSIILPEGAQNVEVSTPFPVDQNVHTKRFTNLDTTGRYKITLVKRNVVKEHEQDVTVTYDYPLWRLAQKPLAASVLIMGVFSLGMILSRIDFHIGGKIQLK